MKIGEISLKWLGHAGFLIENSAVIYIDPYQIKDELPKADYILLTHGHYDHCSYSDLSKIVQEGTKIIMTADCQSSLNKFNVPIKMEIVEPGQELDFNSVKISVVSAYNLQETFHPKNENLVGYIIKINDVLIYHAGDSDFIPEMQKLTGYNHKEKQFIALLPVGGRFTMDVESAFEVAKLLKPALVIPMHWGSIIGTKEDAEEFVKLCSEENINAKILGRE